MKKNISTKLIYIAICIFLTLIAIYCRKRGTTISEVDFRKIKNGIYIGNSVFSGHTVVVEARVSDKRVTNITVFRTVPGEGGQKAINIIPRIIGAQSLNVPLIQKAENESMAILKAVENALSKGL